MMVKAMQTITQKMSSPSAVSLKGPRTFFNSMADHFFDNESSWIPSELPLPSVLQQSTDLHGMVENALQQLTDHAGRRGVLQRLPSYWFDVYHPEYPTELLQPQPLKKHKKRPLDYVRRVCRLTYNLVPNPQFKDLMVSAASPQKVQQASTTTTTTTTDPSETVAEATSQHHPIVVTVTNSRLALLSIFFFGVATYLCVPPQTILRVATHISAQVAPSPSKVVVGPTAIIQSIKYFKREMEKEASSPSQMIQSFCFPLSFWPFKDNSLTLLLSFPANKRTISQMMWTFRATLGDPKFNFDN